MLAATKTAALCGLLLLCVTANPLAQGGLALNASAAGNTVNLSWTPVPGAVLYGIEAHYVGGPTLPLTPVGNQTSLSIPGVPPGTYLVRITASTGAQSNISTVVVAAPGAAVPAPTDFAASVAGNAVTFSWTLPPTAGLLALGAEMLSGPGGAVVAQQVFRLGQSAHMPHVPNGVYTLRLRAVGAGGISPPSNEITFGVPSCSAPPSIPINIATTGNFVTLSWQPPPGVLGYQLNASSVPGGSPNVLSQALPPGMTTVSRGGLTPGNYYVTLFANVGCGIASSGEQLVSISNATPPTGPRGPVITNPCPNAQTACHPSQYPNLAQAEQIVHAVAAQFPGDLRNSCAEHGGNNIWLFRVVQALRQVDSRWGLMWKRRVIGDMSQDVIAYQFSAAPDEGSDQMYAWDVIAGHCGSSPSPWFNNISSLNPSGAIWTLQPYLAAGFPP
jgi:hypothetical protein